MAPSTTSAPSLPLDSLYRQSSAIRTGCANERPSGSVRGVSRTVISLPGSRGLIRDLFASRNSCLPSCTQKGLYRVLWMPSSASVVFGFAYIDYISTIVFFTANGNPASGLVIIRIRSLLPLKGCLSMARTAFLWFCVLLLAIGALFLGQNGCAGSNTSGNGGGNSPTNGGSSSPNKIQHVVVVFQENRTPDNLFHGLPNADIANSGVNSLGQTIPLQPIPLANRYDLGHRHNDFLRTYDNGKMDGADKVAGCNPNLAGCPPNPQFQYVNPSDVAPYFQLAQQYTFGDRMFQTNQGPSFPAHQFIISGTSAPTATSTLFAAENTNLGAGCTASPGAWVWMIDSAGVESS